MRLSVEQLEQRRLLTTITWSALNVLVEGTDQSDTIVAEVVDGHLVFSGSDVQIPWNANLQLQVHLRDGNDSFTNNTDLVAKIYGEAGDDILIGGSNKDSLYGAGGTDQLFGRDGDDYLSAGNNPGDRYIGGAGFDENADVTTSLVSKKLTVYGSVGDDELRIISTQDYPPRFQIDGKTGTWLSSDITTIEVKLGDGNDTFLNQTSRAVSMFGEAGDDSLSGYYGDSLNGGDGRDTLHGSSQVERLTWLNSTLYIQGTDGDDLIVLRSNANNEIYLEGMTVRWPQVKLSIEGLEGDDRIINLAKINNYSSDFAIRGGDGNDMILGGNNFSSYRDAQLYGDTGNDYIQGTKGDDIIDGGTGNDILRGGAGSDEYRFSTTGYFERDRIRDNYTLDENGINLQYAVQDVTYMTSKSIGWAMSDNREIAIRGYLASVTTGGGNDHVQVGPETRDIVTGAGDDEIDASAASVYAGADNDLIFLGAAIATVSGGSGNDRITILYSSNGRIYGDDSWGGTGNDIIYGSQGHDDIDGGSGNDQIFGLGGNDRLVGGSGADQLDGGEGNDSIWGASLGYSRESFWIIHEASDNILLGGLGDDFLMGSEGRDRLFGGQGFDTIKGDKNVDTLLDESLDGDLIDGVEILPPSL